ncbi:MAG: acetyl/propionyl/methylcrotonyl-CoA carboxylase subunit alpha [Kangiellaceae bacterium]|jgi:3-methylcrotonyl-CoA carboxylase alpha subunit|nr:acetyl/propionyl/methylcrotonyl-CoA carboxylase subunit alpha [Kangiellaceae bacterium]
MFNKLLIANRGEIACRVIKTANKLGIKTVAIFSDADRNARHVRLADEAFYVGPSPANESYLNIDNIIAAAKHSGAEAIHPGYGFLSENTHFAKVCDDNNIVFVGPPSSAIDAMGSKSAAKDIMQEAGVPLVPGYHGENQEPEFLLQQANDMGYPVLIKATAGGGGKGMRIVKSEAEFLDALASCQREAKKSFANDRVLIEKYLVKPRHIELQIFADNFDNAVHLFERDCSLQRRYQKVIEEAPAPDFSEESRQQMGQVAIQAAKAIGYRGAGTVEFLYDSDGSFYFMEMNTRLQVEHPVTELITGQDLVEWQLLVANNQPLPLTQDQLKINGHAFEARIYAEDPNQDFLPQTGTVEFLQTPNNGNHVRIDTGIEQDDEISVYYDPMIAKLIVWDKTRSASLNQLLAALKNYQLSGLTTNIEFLTRLAAHPAFANVDLDTHFIERYKNDLQVPQARVSDEALIAAACQSILNNQVASAYSNDQDSPWNQINGWRSNHNLIKVLSYSDASTDLAYQVEVEFVDKNQFSINIDQKTHTVTAELNAHQVSLVIDNQKLSANVINSDNQLSVFIDQQHFNFSQNLYTLDTETANANSLTAPMPGTILQVLVEKDQTVQHDQPLLIMEAMKMEHTIKAPADGVVKDIYFNAGELVNDGVELIEFESE